MPAAIAVECDRDRGIPVKAPLLFFRHLRSHERRCLEAVLMEPELRPERFAGDERLCRIAPAQPVE